MAILMIILSLSTTVTSAATVQPKVQEKPAVETTAVPANTNDGKATKTYSKSMQMKIFESVIAGKEEGKKELARVQTQIVTLKENTVAIDEIGLAWKSGKGQDVVKVRVTSDKIQFEWTPIYRGYTWISDLSMWSDGKLPGREAILEFLDKDGKVFGMPMSLSKLLKRRR